MNCVSGASSANWLHELNVQCDLLRSADAIAATFSIAQSWRLLAIWNAGSAVRAVAEQPGAGHFCQRAEH
jgi:hypothetical protein